MDWNRAIDINKAAITRVVAEIYALLELVLAGRLTRLPREVYLAATQLLHPTESALRRLIVIAARGLNVELLPSRAMPQGVKPKLPHIVRTRMNKAPSFRLFDSRKELDYDGHENAGHAPLRGGPHIRTVESFLESRTIAQPPMESFDASKLCRRFRALKHALDTLPHQALRMARWQLRRKSLSSAKFTSPLRPGPPPGIRQRPKFEIDHVLRQCHDLAHYALSLDSS